MNQKNSSILSTSFFGNIQYFSKFLKSDFVFIEKYENYSRQSYRNRCQILGANGIQILSIPVKKNAQLKSLITDVEIDYSENWQTQHLQSLKSAYKNSPFYDFYIDDMVLFFEKEYKFLFDYNNLITTLILEMLGINKKLDFTKDFFAKYDLSIDYRDSIHPKKRMQKPDESFTEVKYHQVFDEKFGFTPNLSILDLIFNEGPNSLDILTKSINLK